jgi:glycosyltransferase involved in cell wall biosynthesis
LLIPLFSAGRGVFANVALQEPFGLTIIEAAAHGVPVVATKWGGPTDILDTLKNGYAAQTCLIHCLVTKRSKQLRQCGNSALNEKNHKIARK